MIASCLYSTTGVQSFASDHGNPPTTQQYNDAADGFETKSPIKHVIILIGENRGHAYR